MTTRRSAIAATAVAAATMLAGAAGAQPAPGVNGEVTKVDRAQARVTLKHGEIKNLDMPAMTMVFRVREPRMLEGLAVGDRVRFTAEKVDGQFTVTSITKTR